MSKGQSLDDKTLILHFKMEPFKLKLVAFLCLFIIYS